MRYGWLLVFLSAAVLTGCNSSPKTVPLSGEVTFDGQPVVEGTIQFIPDKGTPGRATGGIIADGRYTLSKEAGPQNGGTYLVRIVGLRETGRMSGSPDIPNSRKTVEKANYIPAIYNSQTTLKVAISESPLDFRLEKTPTRR
ncbi:MAG: hypothetical protein JW818_22990 [Pirellulales bacterium]|nr:hypothetical protein [Pirellulales bacterium]